MKITFSTCSGKTAHLEVDKLGPYILAGGSAESIRKVAGYLEYSEVIIGKRGHVVVNGIY